jgi:hypothetical protein
MDAVVAALVGGVTQLQRMVAGQGGGPLFRVRSVLSPCGALPARLLFTVLVRVGTLSVCPAVLVSGWSMAGQA